MTGAARTSLHLTMRDGVRVAVDVWLPSAREGRLPTALRSTRYWRAGEDDPLRAEIWAAEARRWTGSGFALVTVDARGTGASTGTWLRLYDDDQRDDLVEVVDWVVAQDWSDGTVGGFGTSYDGTTAHLLAATGHPAVRAVVPRFGQLDGFHHVGAPGGVPLDWFVETWAAANWFLDGHPERSTLAVPLPLAGRPRPVDGDDDGALLAAARAEHAGNWDLWGTFRQVVSREDAVGADGVSADAGGPLGRLKELRAARVPMWVWSAWYDGAYAAAALAQLADDELDVRVTIGPWAHGANGPDLGSPFQQAPISPDPEEQQRLMAGFLRHHARGDVADPAPARLRFYTLGAEEWQEADRWPPAGTVTQQLYLGAGALTAEPPAAHVLPHDVDPAASTGTQTRWHTLFGGVPVAYADRREADRRLLVFDGPVLERDLEVTGTPALSITLACDREDTAVFAYLEDVAPDGTVTYLTEGQLRALHRRPGTGSAPYETYGPWHSYAEADTAPLEPDVPVELELALWPVSVLLRAGHRLRLALAGADAGLFRQVPAGGAVRWRLHLGGGPDAARLHLPVRSRD